MERLLKQLDFLIEIDKLKTILRRNYIADGSKRENDAEHSWYFAIAAIVLAEYANKEVNIQKVIKMAIIHDIVEVYAGDTFVYDEKARVDQSAREKIAAEKIFGLLPEDQNKQLLELWTEFEANITNESRFAKAIDRMVAELLNLKANGKTWIENKLEYAKVYEMNKEIGNGASKLWLYMKEMLEKHKGLFADNSL